MSKIVVIGSSNVDLIMKMDHLPEKGETVTNAEFYQVYGGKGANQAVAAARAGGAVTFVTCVGEDAYTPQMVLNYIHDGIDTQFVFPEQGIASGHALIMIGGEGMNYISVAPGANYRLTPEKINLAKDAFGEAAMIVMQFEVPEETIRYVTGIARQRKIPVMWNVAPARPFDFSFLPEISILVLNEVEAGFLAGMQVRNEEEADIAARKLLAIGVERVIVTLGSRGAMAVTVNEKVAVPAFRVDAVDTTAAGDTFCGTLAVALSEGKSMKEALTFASAAAAISVTRMGAQPSAPFRKEIEDFLSGHQPF